MPPRRAPTLAYPILSFVLRVTLRVERNCALPAGAAILFLPQLIFPVLLAVAAIEGAIRAFRERKRDSGLPWRNGRE